MLGRSVVAQADVTALRMQSSQLDTRASSIDTNANTLVSKFSGAPWTGKARDAADNRAESERREHRRVADDIRALSKQLSSGADGIERLATTLKRDSTNLEAENYSVSEQWQVADLLNYALAFYVADANDDAAARAQLEKLQRERADEAARETHRLTGLAGELTALDQRTASAVTGHLQTIGRLAPVAAGLSKSRAQRDMATLAGKNLDGSTPSDEQEREAAERLHAAADLDHNERDQLTNSADGKAQVSQEQFDYLKGVTENLPDKVADYDNIGASGLNDAEKAAVRGDVGDALRLVGNPSISTPSGERGGMTQLPKNVQSLLKESPTTKFDFDRIRDDVPESVTAVEIKRLDDWKGLTNSLGAGDQSLRLGSDVDRGLLKQASEIAGQVTPGTYAQEYGVAATPHLATSDANARQTLDAMLNNASGDHLAVHDFVTGEGMQATISGHGGYIASDHMLSLLQHKWSPDEHGVQNVFDWLNDPALVTDKGYQGELTGHTATALAGFLSDNAHQLNHIQMQGADGIASLGAVNPGLTRSLTQDLIPHLGGLAAMPDTPLSNAHVSGFERTAQLSDLIGVLASDPESAKEIHRGAQDWIRIAAYEAGLHPEIDTDFASHAGSLQAALKDGLGNQLEAIQQNTDYSEAVHDSRWGTMYDTASGAASLIPGVGPLVDIISPEAKLALQGPVDFPGSPVTDPKLRDLAELQERSGINPLGPQIAWTEGYLRNNPADRFKFDEFLSGGQLDWNKIHEAPGAFRELSSRLPESITFSDYFDQGSNADDLNPTRRK